MTRDEILGQLKANTAELAGLKTDPGFLADLEIFLSKTLDRYDPEIRAALPKANTLISSLGPAGAIAAVLLGITEGPALTLIESVLDADRIRIQTSHNLTS